MEKYHEGVTLLWRNRPTGEVNRFTLSRRAVLLWGGAGLAAILFAVVAGAVAWQAHRLNAALNERVRELQIERAALEQRLARSESEMAAARHGLEQVRAAEAKIRSWLGLETEPAETDLEASAGGKGSLGDVDMGLIAPRDRGAVTEGTPERVTALGVARTARVVADDLADLATRVEEQRRSWDRIPAISPVDGEHWISSGFGWRKSPFTGKREFHSGVDMAGQTGTPIVAPAEGLVVRVVKDAALGRSITIDHGAGIQTVYGHLNEILVRKGQRVSRGAVVGEMGSTGRRSTGPHLHYAVKEDGKFVNPRHYMLERGRVPVSVARALPDF